LVRDDALDAVDLKFAPGQGLAGGSGHRRDGAFEHFLSVHFEKVEPVGNGLARGRVQAATARL